MQSVMKHNFSRIPSVEIPRSVFDRSHGYKTTFDAGVLVPFYVDEALPGDSFTASASLFARLATPIVPIMDNLFMETFYFAVPYRLVWDNWQKFNGEQTDPGDSTDFLIPQVESGQDGFQAGGLEDYFGLPTDVAGLSVSCLWHRAYNLIWNEWFRDQNLQDSVVVNRDDGPDDKDDYGLLYRTKRHDYFTSCLPWPQKGPGVEIPIGTSAPVFGTGLCLGLTDGQYSYGMQIGQGSAGMYPNLYQFGAEVGNYDAAAFEEGSVDKGLGVPEKWETQYPDEYAQTGLYADLSSAQAATINSLRQAFQLQKLFERDARGGTRYTEIIRSHFGVISPDARLQRPEYLGGSSVRININPVQQTAPTQSGTTPQGNLAAYGLASDTSGGFTKSFTEHTLIIGLVNVRADITYQRGIPRMFSRQTRYDHYWPALAHLGEQEVLHKEIYAVGNEEEDTEVFGYQERWAEYRYFPSQITGKFRSTDPQSLDIWHLSEDFGITRPDLNSQFIQDKTATVIDRAIAVPSEPQILFDSYINLRCARPMPVYSVPGMIDHF